MAAYKSAILAGMRDAEFWASTPYLTKLFIDAAVERERISYRHDILQAWQVAAFSRVKRLPSLDKVLRSLDVKSGASRRMPPAAILAQVELWNAAFGGADTRKLH